LLVVYVGGLDARGEEGEIGEGRSMVWSYINYYR